MQIAFLGLFLSSKRQIKQLSSTLRILSSTIIQNDSRKQTLFASSFQVIEESCLAVVQKFMSTH